ncbi:ABC transporter permease [Clostridium cochlearium]|uniref:ABC transporter permease n=1 Tax=Clostridium cochlearium TaxID=1494 RepID=UPI00156F3B4D|nr:FtsX-like permease family protein [Clostridium cochlearium]MBV1818122.1 FtsX-like permease family protein [Bacteroidales bacterium MSK.15.36]MCG4580075.1 FtsX-like permease family protein [Clostridium cochlearium]NSJ90920.1 FtsX-like permease family protein [Coprococcus sp. MSK.21.13]
MKSYLSLIPISAKLRRRQNNMTLLCIIFAVFLVTSIFSMADMGVRMEKIRLIEKHGSEALEGLSTNRTVYSYYIIASLLFLLILVAGVLMISSSINSNISQRTKFFGMMRCIGMSKRQIIRFVRLEALNWCKKSIPIGVLLGVLITWILSAILKFAVAGEFTEIPLFGISLPGIISGILMGVIAVLISASSPAKKASKVSPIAAVSGNSSDVENITHGVNLRFCRVETSLGFHHAVSKKKNFILMTSSFALSIILFLSFSVFIDFVGHIMPQYSNTPDITISSKDGLNSIDSILIDQINAMNGVNHIFGRRNIMDIPVKLTQDEKIINKVDIISYDNFDLDCIAKDKQLIKNSDISKVYGNSNYVIITPDAKNKLKIGDKIQIKDRELEIAGILKYDLFSNDGSPDGNLTLISSSETFTSLTGKEDYSLIMVQTTKDVTDEDVEKISNIVNTDYIFCDIRDQRTTSVYIAFKLFIYGFLGIIALVTILNIMNSIALSVSARTKQYGAMRAVGMSQKQITKMIIAEAIIYATSGCVVGSILGLFLSNRLYYTLITKHFSYATWKVPFVSLIIILLFVIIAIILAVYKPIKYMRNISITETINEL